MRLYELAYACRLYAALGDFDSSFIEFREAVKPALDLRNHAHRKALLVWLNSWGCRQFAKDYHSMASKALVGWGRLHLNRLPHKVGALAELSDSVLDGAAEAYGDLKDRNASLRSRKSDLYRVTFGPTGAAKILFALRPNALPPWDEPIRKYFGYDGSAHSYRDFLNKVREEVCKLQDEAANFGISANDIPACIGRPDSGLPKLIDEYYWVTITSGYTPLGLEDLERWTRWARGPIG